MIYIRADANSHIGMGHIMRCLSIADAARDDGQDVKFIIADDTVENLIKNRGFESIILHSDYEKMEDELPLWPKDNPDIVVVDSYYVTDAYFISLKKRISKGIIAYMDDLLMFPYPIDVLINYNIYARKKDYEVLYENNNKKPQFMLGLDYTPLRKLFRELESKKQNEKVKDILISSGGSDLEHVALSIVKARPHNYTYHILVGALNVDLYEIKELASEQSNIIVHENVADMQSLISEMDIVVSAGGTTMYEICACGVPIITYISADNQMMCANAFTECRLALNIGDIRGKENVPSAIIKEIDCLSSNYDRRIKIGKRMQELIDGYGADRLIKRILKI